MDTFECKRCGNRKPRSDFYAASNSRGFDSSCKDCRKLVIRKRRNDNIDYVRAYDRARGKTEKRKLDSIIRNRKRRKDPDGYMAAHNAVARALRSGRIERQPCCMCGTTEKIHAHHDDYMKPLEVMWLCVVHHKSRHAYLEYIDKDIF